MAELRMALLYADCTDLQRKTFFELGDDRFRRSFELTAANLPVLDEVGVQEGYIRRLTIRRAWTMFLQTYPLVLTPTGCVPPLPIDHDTVDEATMQRITQAYRPLPLVAGLGLPGLTVPAGMVGDLHVGIQLIDRWFDDKRCLGAAETLETRIGPLAPVHLKPL